MKKLIFKSLLVSLLCLSFVSCTNGINSQPNQSQNNNQSTQSQNNNQPSQPQNNNQSAQSQNNVNTNSTIPNNNFIGEEKAKTIAIQDAKLNINDVKFTRVSLEHDNGISKYDVEFFKDNKEYDYDIDAFNGRILSKDFDIENFIIPNNSQNNNQNNNNQNNNQKTNISEAQAKNIALQNAKVAENQINFIKSSMDMDDGRIEYDISFFANGKKYEYSIDANSGQIIDFEIE